MHRALFIASLATKPSDITGCGSTMSDDVLATIGALRAFGIEVKHSLKSNGTLRVFPGETNRSLISVFARGSGTTARFTIAFAALAKEGVARQNFRRQLAFKKTHGINLRISFGDSESNVTTKRR